MNNLPLYSIDVYDDSDFLFKRQIKGGVPLLSNIISDDYYPFATSDFDKKNYINGLSSREKQFFIKVVVEDTILDDIIGQNSKTFYLVKNIIFSETYTIYYSMECIEKLDGKTIYRSIITLNESDQDRFGNGLVIFSLLRNQNVELVYPIVININNSATSVISQSSPLGITTVASLPNFKQYFLVNPVDFEYFELSSQLSYNFLPISPPQSLSLFSTSTTIFSVESSATLRFFVKPDEDFIFNYLGVTLSSINNPSLDMTLQLIVQFKDGYSVSVEPYYVYKNQIDGYWNLVFILNNIDYQGLLDYFLFAVTSPTQTSVTFLAFLEKNSEDDTISNVSSLSLKALSNDNILNNNFVFLPDGTQKYITSIDTQIAITSPQLYTIIESVGTLEKIVLFEIKTVEYSLILPENFLIQTKEGFQPLHNISPNDELFTISGFQLVKSIKVLPPSTCTFLDVSENETYFYNGFSIKNPTYPKGAKYKILPKTPNSISKKQNFTINGALKYLFPFSKNIFYYENLFLLATKTHTLEFQKEATYVKMFLDLSSETIINHLKKNKYLPGEHVVEYELKEQGNITLKSNDQIKIKKIIILYAT